MAISTEILMQKIEARVAYLLKTESPKEDLENMYRLQKEHHPHLSREQAEDYVILGLVETHKDHELDHLWYQYKNLTEKSDSAVA